jgi:hypothetical protein
MTDTANLLSRKVRELSDLLLLHGQG